MNEYKKDYGERAARYALLCFALPKQASRRTGSYGKSMQHYICERRGCWASQIHGFPMLTGFSSLSLTYVVLQIASIAEACVTTEAYVSSDAPLLDIGIDTKICRLATFCKSYDSLARLDHVETEPNGNPAERSTRDGSIRLPDGLVFEFSIQSGDLVERAP